MFNSSFKKYFYFLKEEYNSLLYNINMKRWTTSNKAVFNLGYHLIWCSKYRRDVLADVAVEKRLKQLLLEKAKKIEVEIVTM